MSETPNTTRTAEDIPAAESVPATGGVPATGVVPATGAGSAEADALIAARRQRIDDLDERIIALVRERMAVSGEIQAARIGSGGRRVHLARELQVLRTYGDALGGRPGTAVAMTLLELCRSRA